MSRKYLPRGWWEELKKTNWMRQEYPGLTTLPEKEDKKLKSDFAKYLRESESLFNQYEVTEKGIRVTSITGRGASAKKMQRILDIYDPDAYTIDKKGRLKKASFLAQISSENIKQAYGYDIFAFIRDRGITDYNISEGWYIDPVTGAKLSF